MRVVLLLLTLLIPLTACDYREYPQEEEWKEDFEQKIEDQEENEP